MVEQIDGKSNGCKKPAYNVFFFSKTRQSYIQYYIIFVVYSVLYYIQSAVDWVFCSCVEAVEPRNPCQEGHTIQWFLLSGSATSRWSGGKIFNAKIPD